MKITDDDLFLRELSKSRSFLQTKALEVTRDFSKPRTIERSMDERVLSNVQILPKIMNNNVTKELNSQLITEMQQVKINDKEEMEMIPIPKPSCDIKLPYEINKKNKSLTSKAIMKKRKLEREKEFREVLSLPFIAYRRNSEGRIVELDHPPVIRNFKEPSNKGKYKMRKILGEERNHYQDSIDNLARITDEIIQEGKHGFMIRVLSIFISDNRRIRLLNAPKHLHIPRKSVFETRPIGPEHWMKAFVSSNIPDDVDPSSTEAIIYCRYIRAPLESYSHLPNYLLYHTPL